MKSSDAKVPSEIFFKKYHFLSGTYIYVQLFHLNWIETDLYIAITVKSLNLNMIAW